MAILKVSSVYWQWTEKEKSGALARQRESRVQGWPFIHIP